METSKKCSICKTSQKKSNFNKCKSNHDGMSYTCRFCEKEYRQRNRVKIKENNIKYRSEYKDLISERKKEYYIKNCDYVKDKTRKYSKINKEKIKKKSADYYLANKESISKKSKEYAMKNKEFIKEYRRQYYIRNKESASISARKYYEDNSETIKNNARKYLNTDKGRAVDRLSNRKRRALKITTSDNTISKESLSELMIIQNSKCFYCKVEIDSTIKYSVHLDHYIPISKGGIHSIFNVVWSCAKCNMVKHNTIPKTLLLI